MMYFFAFPVSETLQWAVCKPQRTWTTCTCRRQCVWKRHFCYRHWQRITLGIIVSNKMYAAVFIH